LVWILCAFLTVVGALAVFVEFTQKTGGCEWSAFLSNLIMSR
jgi:hypothetical protein